MNHNSKVIRAILEGPVIGPNDILYALDLAGAPTTRVAEDCGCTREFVYAVVCGRRRSFDIATYIAANLGTTTRRLWGDAYDYTPRGSRSEERKVANG